MTPEISTSSRFLELVSRTSTTSYPRRTGLSSSSSSSEVTTYTTAFNHPRTISLKLQTLCPSVQRKYSYLAYPNVTKISSGPKLLLTYWKLLLHVSPGRNPSRMEIQKCEYIRLRTGIQCLTRTTRQMKIAKSANTLTISSPVFSSKVIQLK